MTASVFIRLRRRALLTASTICSAMVFSTTESAERHFRGEHCSRINMPHCSPASSSGTASMDSIFSVAMCSCIGSNSRAPGAQLMDTGSPLAASCCSTAIILTIATTSDCLTPGAQYSRAADGGLPGVHSPATQRWALKCLPISFTAVKSTLLTFTWR